MTTPEMLAEIDTTLAAVDPHVGDHYLSGCLVNTVTEVTVAKVVLTHPLAGEIHLPRDDFARLVASGTFEHDPS